KIKKMNNNYNFDFNTKNKFYKNSNLYRYNQNTCLSLLENYFGRKGIFSASCKTKQILQLFWFYSYTIVQISQKIILTMYLLLHDVLKKNKKIKYFKQINDINICCAL
ncbi:hypothetical protein EDEG_04164, partial [Edhazardia aedis USNM 41457]